MKPIAIIGLGYVGLPVAAAFGVKRPVLGFDIDQRRIEELSNGRDRTLEVSDEALRAARHLRLTSDPSLLSEADTFIITVPTPVDEKKNPDLRPVKAATQTVGAALKVGDLVIYESTVFPGCTEEVCVPLLELCSGLTFNRDFTVGFSPERINPGDHIHRLETIVKVVSGSTPEAGQRVQALYNEIITAGTHLAPSLKVAEAAKVIENTQRDLNIAFINELALIFQRMGIDTLDVLEAAGTKWNFLPFRPGLVGGHCIGVDPYYLTEKAQALGYDPQVILAGRRINDAMGQAIANRVLKLMIKSGHRIQGARILVLGITFKENCPDIRNTKVVDVIHELQEFGCDVDCFDPVADHEEVKQAYGLEMIAQPQGPYTAIILAVAHQAFKEWNPKPFSADATVVFDIKSFWPRSWVHDRL
jgi:UDP-N-acetyl-D-galactosamine dehydrogenase